MRGLTRRPRAILVDLDDTLISDSADGEANWTYAVKGAAAFAAFPVEAVTAALIREREWYFSDPERHRVGRLGLVNAYRQIVRAALVRAGVSESDRRDLEIAIVAAYRARADSLRTPLPGALDALAGLRDLGIRLALLTNGAAEPQRAKIERFGLAAYFDAILIEGELGAGKPEVRVYEEAMMRLGVRAQDAWMVGDNLDLDVIAPRRLGMRGLWISPTGVGAQDNDDADAVLRDLAAVLRLVRTLAPAEGD